MSPKVQPRLPYPEFPLRPHRNGQWYKSVWNPRSRKSEQFYFGPWKDDPKGRRALHDPVSGWLARRDAILAGTDNVHVGPVATAEVTLGELMARFLAHKRNQVRAGELALCTLGEYIHEVQRFVAFQKPAMPAGALRPEHFSAYVQHLVVGRGLGRHGRERVRAYVNCFLHFGVNNGWFTKPPTGVEWVAPATDPDSMRVARARAGVEDLSDRIFSRTELRRVLKRASPTFKALILLGVNCGLGPADLGRLRWRMIDLKTGRMVYPRHKTGVMRVGYVWKRTRRALARVRTLKYNRLALEKEGENALVFITRENCPFYRVTEVHKDVVVDGQVVRKLAGAKVHNAISSTFNHMCHELGLEGLSFYRLRHTFRTLGTRGRDREALDRMTGHKDSRTARIYEHEPISWKRVRRVALVIHRQLWPSVRPKEGTRRRETRGRRSGGSAAA